MLGKGCENYGFSIIPSVMDCTGCGSCFNVCPAKDKALEMTPIEEMKHVQKVFDYAYEKVSSKPVPFAENTVKGSQFNPPLLEFSGACAGCGETPYAKLVTQLFGDRMYIANARLLFYLGRLGARRTVTSARAEGLPGQPLFEDNANSIWHAQAVAAQAGFTAVKSCE